MAAKQPVGQLKVKARDQSKLLLGSFETSQSPKGYSLSVTPEIACEAIVSQIMSMDARGRRSLILQVANKGTKPVKVEVWEL